MAAPKFIASAIVVLLIRSEFLFSYANDAGKKCTRSELEALLNFREGLVDPEHRLLSWKGNYCCQWHGIGCDNSTGAVNKIDLHNPYPLSYGHDQPGRYGFWNLSGEIRPSLLKLKSLTYFDLSYNTFTENKVPEFIGFLRNLRYLNLSTAGFSGRIPQSIGNLSRLQYLDVSSNFGSLNVQTLEWLTKIRYLKHLKMTNVDLSHVGPNWWEMLNNLTSLTMLHLSSCGLSTLSRVDLPALSDLDLSMNSFDSKFPDWVLNLTRLSSIDLSNCGFYGRVPLSLGELQNLRYLSLAINNKLTASCTQLFKGSWPKIEVLDFASNKLHGKIPAAIGNMTSLTSLDLFDNNVEGGIPGSIGKLCNLKFLSISGNNMTGSLPEVLEGVDTCVSNSPMPNLEKLWLTNNKLVGRLPEWVGQLGNLEELELDYNQLHGSIRTSLGRLQRLTSLGLGRNKFNGTLPESFGQLSELTNFDVSFNDLSGIVSEAHFLKLSKLTILHLSSNSLILHLKDDWIPPFQVRNLDLGSCQVGPFFPNWLKTQKNINFLDLSNASISDSIPFWFWDMTFNLSLLNISLNQIHGQLPSLLDVAPFADVDLSSNLFEGPIPLPSVEVELFYLSFNKFSGVIPYNIGKIMPNLNFLSLASNRLSGEIPSSIGEMVLLEVIDLLNNSLIGSIPPSIGNCLYLKALDLGYNNLSGVIPQSFGNLHFLQSLHLDDNNFSGELPSSLKNLSHLETMDLANNKFSGDIPPWLADHLTALKILSLRSNSFSGRIPTNFPGLSNLQVLDLALNNLSGMIPTNLGNLIAMSKDRIVNQYRFYGVYRGIYYKERLFIYIEGRFLQYTKTLSLVAYMDLSKNSLHGRFPVELTRLIGLVFLNLSRNQIGGSLPENISSLVQLGSLDLSSNKFSGVIPSSVSSLTFLSSLNMSNNNFSGRIPVGGQMTTFGGSSFSGNPNLCGPPLAVNCGSDSSDNRTPLPNDVKAESDDDKWFPLSIGLGFAIGILVPSMIMWIRRPWGDAYFNFVESVVHRIERVKTKTAQITVTYTRRARRPS
ncbi:receptor-like protein EIX1 [Lactuca sativa]|uniref:Leucine-rich repeat-containing N-terminal plant-type domain-containing protein n=1 Tax=Lactuca sativa TaxID=4236 RepID=A0A9R1WNT5_LACSA|nr:receptor-like protein EIX1 [Lactuca sativa]KAJ0227054.1 hypothetical protein LSAT_V11C100041940 [Lactuca sativa]